MQNNQHAGCFLFFLDRVLVASDLVAASCPVPMFSWLLNDMTCYCIASENLILGGRVKAWHELSNEPTVGPPKLERVPLDRLRAQRLRIELCSYDFF